MLIASPRMNVVLKNRNLIIVLIIVLWSVLFAGALVYSNLTFSRSFQELEKSFAMHDADTTFASDD